MVRRINTPGRPEIVGGSNVAVVLAYLKAAAADRRQVELLCRCSNYRAAEIAEVMIDRAVGPGWLPLVYDLHGLLLGVDAGYQLFEVKAVLGGLRFGACFTPAATELGQAMINAATELAAATCEVCGRDGELRRERPRWRTLCGECLTLDRRAASENGERYADLRLARLLKADPRFPTPEAIIACFPEDPRRCDGRRACA